MNRSSRAGTWRKRRCACRGDVRFEDVGFSYGKEGAPALQQISFHASPGETIALVGTTGAGKSTLVNLLTRFYEYDTGEILIDGTPIREFGMRRLREMIAVVTQESFLFNGTIRENLLMGQTDGDATPRCWPRRRRRTRASSSIGCRKGWTASWASAE